MKNIFIVLLLIVCGFRSTAQDSTVVTNFTIQAQDVLVLMPYLNQPDDSSRMNMYIRYNTVLNTLGNNITATTPITIPSISVTNILQMYLNIAGTPAGFGLLVPFQTSLAPYRTANHNLATQCTQLETNYVANKMTYFLALLKIGRGY